MDRFSPEEHIRVMGIIAIYLQTLLQSLKEFPIVTVL